MFKKSLFYLFLLISNTVFATRFSYPENEGDVLIGDKATLTRIFYSSEEETLLDIARDFNVGQNEILRTNPGVDRWMPGDGTKISIPHSRLLPDTAHQGLVLNLPEFRLYYYPKPAKDQIKQVITHPISVGRVGWNTPLGKTSIISKIKDPVWRPPPSIRKEYADNGEILPAIFPAGPDNPFGLFALGLNIPGYFIHGTNKPYGVGMRVSHGCVRMYPEDIKEIFSKVKVGTQVTIVNQAIKVGWSDNELYIEVYPELEGRELGFEKRLDTAMTLIEKVNNGKMPVLNGHALKQALQKSTGIPVVIYSKKLILSVGKNSKKTRIH